jgi:uncharacterized protein (TIGR02453 family)
LAHFDAAFFSFFTELAENNNREWFQANKRRYERDVKDACLGFITDFGPYLHDISPHFTAIPKAVGGSMFRIYRDTRFSKDKTPYKTNAGLHFRHETAKGAHTPGFYLHLDPQEVSAGVGIWAPPTPVLNKIRMAIDTRQSDWQALRDQVESQGLVWYARDQSLKRVPRGFDKDHVFAEDLKLKSFCFFKPLSVEAAQRDDFVEVFAKACADCLPLVRFVGQALDVAV